MLPRHIAEYLTDALAGMARANWYDFVQSPKLCEEYLENLKAGRCKYVADKVTCGFADCWSTYRSLCERYKGKRILLDCEDAACAHAGWLRSQCYKKDKIFVGLVPGRKVSHAICGIKRDGKMIIIDPARWFGMGPTTYNNPVWREV